MRHRRRLAAIDTIAASSTTSRRCGGWRRCRCCNTAAAAATAAAASRCCSCRRYRSPTVARHVIPTLVVVAPLLLGWCSASGEGRAVSLPPAPLARARRRRVVLEAHLRPTGALHARLLRRGLLVLLLVLVRHVRVVAVAAVLPRGLLSMLPSVATIHAPPRRLLRSRASPVHLLWLLALALLVLLLLLGTRAVVVLVTTLVVVLAAVVVLHVLVVGSTRRRQRSLLPIPAVPRWPSSRGLRHVHVVVAVTVPIPRDATRLQRRQRRVSLALPQRRRVHRGVVLVPARVRRHGLLQLAAGPLSAGAIRRVPAAAASARLRLWLLVPRLLLAVRLRRLLLLLVRVLLLLLLLLLPIHRRRLRRRGVLGLVHH